MSQIPHSGSLCPRLPRQTTSSGAKHSLRESCLQPVKPCVISNFVSSFWRWEPKLSQFDGRCLDYAGCTCACRLLRVILGSSDRHTPIILSRSIFFVDPAARFNGQESGRHARPGFGIKPSPRSDPPRPEPFLRVASAARLPSPFRDARIVTHSRVPTLRVGNGPCPPRGDALPSPSAMPASSPTPRLTLRVGTVSRSAARLA